ncbi:MAG: Asp-tRNA(Asn)/Glu-tRNA(Gln) amidotransferase subunit GatA [Lentisphaerae bacterium]|nr:Asp-tRNA(Asn)/Glu-tRNA(Gln) amidotransferase subunit GatA [Lentisphaerota bacterium]
MDIGSLTVRAAIDGLRKRQFSSVELTRAVLDAIMARDGVIGAYLWVDEADALKQAAAADAARAGGSDGLLLGVPLAIKDILNVEGQPCTCASKILAGYRAPYDATVIARLREAGAVFAGRTNLDEFAMGSTTENSAIQLTRNPAAPDRVPGGSSGGSAAAVAGGMALAALGTDTGGSIRQPASNCGCVGLKPSYGRVSRYGLVAFASSLDQIGPMTRTVEDASLLLGVMGGRDPRDATTLDRAVPDYAAALGGDLTGLRLGLPKEYFVTGLDPEVARLVQDAVEACRRCGAEIVEVSLPHTEYAVATYYILASAEASTNLARFDGVRYGRRSAVPADTPLDMYLNTRAEGFGREVKRRIILGTYVLSSGYYDAYYTHAQRVRTLIRRDFDEAFKRCDALLTPVSPDPAYLIGATAEDPLKAYLIDIFTVTANLAGICGIAVPCGTTRAGLPVGLQVLAPAFEEGTLLRIGHAYEQAREARP